MQDGVLYRGLRALIAIQGRLKKLDPIDTTRKMAEETVNPRLLDGLGRDAAACEVAELCRRLSSLEYHVLPVPCDQLVESPSLRAIFPLFAFLLVHELHLLTFH